MKKRYMARRAMRYQGFTLMEMLVVVVILGILVTVSVPAVDGMLRSSRLTTTGENVRNFFTEAQQLAIVRNVEVEVRLGEASVSGGLDAGKGIRTLSMLVLESSDGTGDYLPTGSPLILDDSLAVSSARDLSSLLTRPYQADASNPGDRYLSFHFFPDGSTDLPAGELWFLTLVEQRYARDATAPPNFFTIQVHPTSGKLITYRP